MLLSSKNFQQIYIYMEKEKQKKKDEIYWNKINSNDNTSLLIKQSILVTVGQSNETIFFKEMSPVSL